MRRTKKCSYCKKIFEGQAFIHIKNILNTDDLKKFIICEPCKNTMDNTGFVKSTSDELFWKGFDACLNMVLNTIDKLHMHTLPIVLRDEILDEAELYKKDD